MRQERRQAQAIARPLVDSESRQGAPHIIYTPTSFHGPSHFNLPHFPLIDLKFSLNLNLYVKITMSADGMTLIYI